MPTDTFFKLSEEKKNKIVLSAKKEFARVSLEEVSIKNIVEEAGIARGSFYQYFESKEDLLMYLLEEYKKEMEKMLDAAISETNGDIFSVFLTMYTYITTQMRENKEMPFFRNILENMKTNQDSFFFHKMRQNKPDIQEYAKRIDTSSLRLEEEKDIIIIFRMLFIVTKKAIISSCHYSSLEKAREEYEKQLNYLKFGVIKEKESSL